MFLIIFLLTMNHNKYKEKNIYIGQSIMNKSTVKIIKINLKFKQN